MQIGTLTTGAGVATVISGQAQCESMLILGSVSTTNPLRGLRIAIDGQPFFNVEDNATLLSAYAKWLSKFVSTIQGVVFKVATGRIGRSTSYRFVNDGVTTPEIFAFSDADNGVPFLVGTVQIPASSYQDFSKFSALFIGTPANLTSAEIVFVQMDENGNKVYTKQTLAIEELDGLFAQKSSTEADGRLAAVTVIDNSDQSIESVRLYCSAANTIMIAKLPDAAFQVLRAGL